MLATAREQSRALFEDLIMNLRTELVITGLGVAVLMLLAFLTPVDARCRSRLAPPTHRAARVLPPLPSRMWVRGDENGRQGRRSGRRPASRGANLSDAPLTCGRKRGRACFFQPIFCDFPPNVRVRRGGSAFSGNPVRHGQDPMPARYFWPGRMKPCRSARSR